MKTLNLKALTVIGASLFAGASLHANLVNDGTFDDVVYLGLQPTDSVNPTASPWSRNPDQGVIVAGGIGIGGSEAAAFAPVPAGTGPSVLSQTLATSAGQSYSITFWLSGGVPPANATFSVVFGGTTIFTLGPPVATTGGGYQKFVEVGTATSASTLLAFEASPSGDPGTYQPRIDNIDVEAATPVPEPATYVAGALLLVPLGLSILRKKRMA